MQYDGSLLIAYGPKAPPRRADKSTLIGCRLVAPTPAGRRRVDRKRPPAAVTSSIPMRLSDARMVPRRAEAADRFRE